MVGGGEAIKAIEGEMKAMGIEVLEPGLGIIYVPGDNDLKSCVKLGGARRCQPVSLPSVV